MLTDVEDVVFEDTLELYKLEDEYFELGKPNHTNISFL